MRHSLLAHPVLCLLLLAGSDVTGEDVGRKPNFVVIMVDDLGIGDIGCYGNDTIRTPNIDRLATEGVKLTQHITAASLCTPSRAAFVTGRYPICAGMAGPDTERVLLYLANSGGLLPGETTFAERLRQHGYNTGIVGKWHLGVNCEFRGDHCHHPNQQGFSFFYGLPYSLIDDCRPGEGQIYQQNLRHSFFQVAVLVAVGFLTVACLRMCGHPQVGWWLLLVVVAFGVVATTLLLLLSQFMPTWNCIIMRDQEVVEQPMAMETVPQRLLTEAQGFIQRNVEQPFLLFFSLAHIHTPLFINPVFAGKSRHGRYGDNMEEVDWMIGEITKTVDSLGLANNTLMYFTSDHGGHLEDFDPEVGQRGGWNGIYKGGKGMGGWEGGIRVPGIFRWPGRLAAGRVLDEPTSLMDLYPTLKHLSRDTQPDRQLDGHNLMPLLEGTAERSEHEFMFHYCGSYLHAVRWHPPGSDSVYKVHYTTPNFYPPGAVGCYDTMYCECSGERVTQHDPPLLFDLFHDPSEARPLSPDNEPRYAEVLEQSALAVEIHRRSVASAKPQVENQLTWDKLLWRPWLQPCCGIFPFCSCKE